MHFYDLRSIFCFNSKCERRFTDNDRVLFCIQYFWIDPDAASVCFLTSCFLSCCLFSICADFLAVDFLWLRAASTTGLSVLTSHTSPEFLNESKHGNITTKTESGNTQHYRSQETFGIYAAGVCRLGSNDQNVFNTSMNTHP